MAGWTAGIWVHSGIPVCGIIPVLIKSFGDKRTERLFDDKAVKEFRGFAARAKRKLESVNAAARLDDLVVPPSNRLEKLRGKWNEFHSIRINDQWRIVSDGPVTTPTMCPLWTTNEGELNGTR